MKLETLLQSVETLSVKGAVDVEIENLAYDSRRVASGGLFVAIHGHKADGAQYVTEALANGAVAVVSENNLDVGSGAVHIQVQCARRALADIANVFHGDLSRQMKVVGVTGTNGKTTTAYLIRDLLRGGGFQPGLLGTVAYEIGERTLPAARTTPEAPDIHDMFRQMREAGCDSVVMEVSSHAIALQRIHGINFGVTIFTNLSRDHLDYHRDMEDYFDVKSRLFKGHGEKDPPQPAVINIDDPWGRKLLDRAVGVENVMTYGFDEKAMVRASEVEMGVDRTCFHLSSPWGDTRIRMDLLGRFNITNALAALAVGGLFGIDLQCMAAALENIKSIPGRMEQIPNRKNRKIFVDYAHTDDALRNVLETLREICRGKLIVVFGCGGNRDRGKRRLMGQVASTLADLTIITSDNPRKEDPSVIAADIVQGFEDRKAFEVALDRRDAIAKGIRKTGRRDILLIAGKGHEAYQELEETIIPFDDRETVKEILG